MFIVNFEIIFVVLEVEFILSDVISTNIRRKSDRVLERVDLILRGREKL